MIDDILAGVYATESLEYQIRCYNTRVAATAALPIALEPPTLLREASAELDMHINMPEVTDDMEMAFRGIVDPILANCAKHKYVRAEVLQLAILARPTDATLLRIKKGGYSSLKFFMSRIYKAKFVSTARLHGHANPVASCFTNPVFVAP